MKSTVKIVLLAWMCFATGRSARAGTISCPCDNEEVCIGQQGVYSNTTWDWSYTAINNDGAGTANGTLALGNVVINGTGPVGYDITSFTVQSYDGVTISNSGIEPQNYGNQGNDNVFYPTLPTSLLDNSGLMYYYIDPNATADPTVLLSYSNGGYNENVVSRGDPGITFNASEVPEPGAWLLLLTGFLGLAGLLFYRRRPSKGRTPDVI